MKVCDKIWSKPDYSTVLQADIQGQQLINYNSFIYIC